MFLFLFLCSCIIFLLIVITCFYIPGLLFSRTLNLRLSPLEEVFVFLVSGILLFTLIMYCLSWAQIPYAFYVFIVISFVIAYQKKLFKVPNIFSTHKKSVIFVFVLSLFFASTTVFSGDFGTFFRFAGLNLYDSPWHLAVIREVTSTFPPQFPGFSGVQLFDYHFFNSFFLGMIAKLFFLSPYFLYFQFEPILLAFLWGIGSFVFLFRWTQKTSAALWGTFFVMFGGSFSFLFYLAGHHATPFDDGLSITQPASALTNPPFAVSIPIILLALLCLFQFQKTKQKRWLVPFTLATGLITEFKVYAGIILFSAMGFLTLWYILKKKFVFLFVPLVVGILFLATYWVFTGSSGALIFLPLWAPHNMLSNDLLWYGYTEKMYTFSRLHVWHGIIETQLYGIFVFLLGNIGTRIIGMILALWIWYRNKFRISAFSISLLVMTAVSILVPMNFIQSIKPFDMIEMSWYYLFFCALWGAWGFGWLMDISVPRNLKVLFIFVILILTLPSAYQRYYEFFFKPAATITGDQYKTYAFLASYGAYSDTMIQIPSPNFTVSQKLMRQWYRSTTPAIVGFSNKRSYLTYQDFDFPNIDITPRLHFAQTVAQFGNSASLSVKQLNQLIAELKKRHISLIYSPTKLPAFDKNTRIQEIFSNTTATIYAIHEN